MARPLRVEFEQAAYHVLGVNSGHLILLNNPTFDAPAVTLLASIDDSSINDPPINSCRSYYLTGSITCS